MHKSTGGIGIFDSGFAVACKIVVYAAYVVD
jgi:hypothetical protein